MTPVMQRRSFIASTLAAASSQAAPPISIGFLGVAHSHASAKVEIARTSPAWNLVSIWEPDTQLAEKYRQKGIRVVPSRDSLLSEPSVQVIAVESEVATHAEYALLALQAGKHVHVEKPPSVDMAGLRNLAGLARQKNLRLQSGYMWRYHPGFHRIFEAVRQGWLGHVYLVRGQINTLVDASRRPEWAVFPGGHMFELCSHLVDALVRLMGRPAKVTPFLLRHGGFKDELRDNTVAVFEYPRALAVINGATLQPGAGAHRAFEVLGANGTAVLRPIEGPPHLEIDLASPAGPYGKGRHAVDLPPYERYRADFEDLAQSLRTGRPLAASLDDELAVHEVLLRASGMFA